MQKGTVNILLLTLLMAACGKGGNGIPATANKPKTNTWYVSPEGSDAAAGTLKAPFRGINTALGKAMPGDTVMVRKGTYQEKVVFPRSGRLDKYITLKAYTGERPVIDGTDMAITGKEGLVMIKNASYIILEGFEICNFKSSVPRVDVNGILANTGSGNLIIRKNKIHHIEHNVAPEAGRSGHAIEILGSTDVPMKDILIEENEIHDCNTGYSENLTINGYVDGFIIRKNKIYNAENIAIDAAGGYEANAVPANNYARNGVISENEIFNIDMTTGPIGAIHGHGAIGIYIDGARNIIVERNKIYDSDRGIGIVSENDAYPTSNCIVRNNLVYNNWRTGIYLGGYLGYTSGGTRNCYVVNNTLYFNNKTTGAYGEIEGELRMTEQCFDNVIRNNIVYGRPADIFMHKYTNSGSGNVIDDNLYFTTGTPQWIWNSTNGTPVTDLAVWRTTSGNDTRSANGTDPLFTAPGTFNFRLQAASPAKHTGGVISAAINGEVDIAGNPRIVNNKISKGAYQ